MPTTRRRRSVVASDDVHVDSCASDAKSKFIPELVSLRSGLDKVRGLVEQDERTTTQFGSSIGKADDGEAKAKAALRNLEGGAA